MKKLLCVFDGAHFSNGTVVFAAQLNDPEPILLTGFFLSSVDYADAMVYYLGGLAAPMSLPASKSETEAIKSNIQLFKTYCVKNTIEHRVHWNGDINGLELLRKETRYADLLILSSDLFYSNLGKGLQQEYMHDIIHKAECPVVVVPEIYSFPQSVIIAYDGSASSVFALKQFAYLFPQLSENQTLVIYASPADNNIPDLPYLEELAARHFKNLSFYKLGVDPKKYFNAWITEQGNSILVTGAYGRSILSELLTNNFADEIIKEKKIPVFIAHH